MKDIYERYIDGFYSLAVPGVSPGEVVIFDENGHLHTERVVLTHWVEVEDYINSELIPYAFMNGVFCSGMTHGSFANPRNYDKAVNIPNKTAEDYDFDYDILNFVHAVMAAANEYRLGKKMITLILYSNDSGLTIVTEYKDKDDFIFQTKDDIEYFEER